MDDMTNYASRALRFEAIRKLRDAAVDLVADATSLDLALACESCDFDYGKVLRDAMDKAEEVHRRLSVLVTMECGSEDVRAALIANWIKSVEEYNG